MIEGASKLLLLMNNAIELVYINSQTLPTLPQIPYFNAGNNQPADGSSGQEYRIAHG